MEDLPEKYRLDLVFIKETSDQIIKDLSLDDFKFLFTGNAHQAFDEMKQQLIPVVEKIQREDPLRFKGILYRVDISENKFRKAIGDSKENFSSSIAEMIIRREFQKVLIRRYFADNKE